ncbi:uncharacterized protein LOC127247961 isoform X2 [Andrographis paniculata]|uniref:uncharacterized protein LOC127247961 isoform X2 n=1 Tax=Andrographis paniculata TaxID=175694 RepID=UPI0021E8D9E9|nr:uncharacterized protein LOC127247961 isoform X2 [Andrographis paniculata]
MAAGEDSDPSCLFMVSAFLAMEPPDVVLSFARELCGGCITESVQSFIWRRCISKAWQGDYMRRFLKKLIGDIESSGGVVLDELYEQYTSMISLQDGSTNSGNLWILKTISFLFPDESAGISSCLTSKQFEVRLRCSTNMLEGDTGCSIWPSSLFLSEFILSHPEIFANKCCFEVGSGAGLIGICLSYVKASKILLSDGDFSTLANMKFNLELNDLSTGDNTSDNLVQHKKVHCICLPWESATDEELLGLSPDIILGADIIYDPSCLPHLIRILAVLLKHKSINSHTHVSDALPADTLVCANGTGGGPVAYFASVIRNEDTFNYFLALAEESNLRVTDLTGNVQDASKQDHLISVENKGVDLVNCRIERHILFLLGD